MVSKTSGNFRMVYARRNNYRQLRPEKAKGAAGTDAWRNIDVDRALWRLRETIWKFYATSNSSNSSENSSWRRSAISWQEMQYGVHGTAFKRLWLMSSSQCMHTP
jgi:hypothetical protein